MTSKLQERSQNVSKQVIHGHKIRENLEGERGKPTRNAGLKQSQIGINPHPRHGNTGTQEKTNNFEIQETREKQRSFFNGNKTTSQDQNEVQFKVFLFNVSTTVKTDFRNLTPLRLSCNNTAAKRTAQEHKI